MIKTLTIIALILSALITQGNSSVQVNRPVFEGATVITGTAQPHSQVQLRVIQNPELTQVIQAGSDGRFRFELPTPLAASHIVQVTSDGSASYAVVEKPVRVFLPAIMH